MARIQRGVPVFIAVLALSFACTASEFGSSVADQVDANAYRAFLDNELYAHDGYSRQQYSPQHNLARDNIADVLESYGLSVQLEGFNYGGQTWYNVVATQPGTESPTYQYIVGAHYDSVSCPGADDNGSGVAAVVELARVLSQYEFPYTIKYVAFDLEEIGLRGSQAYVAAHRTENIRAMVNFDMISWRGYEKWMNVAGNTGSAAFKETIAEAMLEYANLHPHIGTSTSGSDHVSFANAGILAIAVAEMNLSSNPCYHRDCDSVDNVGYIDYEYGAAITRGIAGFLADPEGVNYVCLGDINGNLHVELGDLATLLAHYGTPDGATEEDGDLDQDGDVDVADLAILLSQFGVDCLESGS